MSNLEQRLDKAIEKGKIDLPVLPAVSAEVLTLTRSEDSDARELAQLIQNDQSLAGHVMRMANSAAYSTRGKIQTLQQAIAMLGMRQIGQMALAATLGKTIFSTQDKNRSVIENLWRHSLACAAWSREVARICRSNTELAFLCGLLHQIGKPIVVNIAANLDGEVEQASLQSAIESYHLPIAIQLAQKWGLPQAVIETIRYIDDYHAAGSYIDEVMIVSAARTLADHMFADADQLPAFAAENEVFAKLNLYDDDLQTLKEKSSEIADLLNALIF